MEEIEEMEEDEERYQFGWIPDYPDFRDYTEEDEGVKLLLEKTSVTPLDQAAGVRFPASVDLRKWCSPIENQGGIGSCTANAGAGVIEYYENRAFGRFIDASRLFLYKATRNLLHWKGDTGAFLRSTMGAMVLFGVPPEEYWPYTDKKPDFDREPPAFCYSFAQNYQAIKYIRLDPPKIPTDRLLGRIKLFIASGLPPMFGFAVYNSIRKAVKGKIPFPCPSEKRVGGHAIVAVGYDDKMKIKNPPCGKETTGALLIRNSWGTRWGDRGYGWLPYDYVLKGLAVDFWAILRKEWVDTEKFKI